MASAVFKQLLPECRSEVWCIWGYLRSDALSVSPSACLQGAGQFLLHALGRPMLQHVSLASRSARHTSYCHLIHYLLVCPQSQLAAPLVRLR